MADHRVAPGAGPAGESHRRSVALGAGRRSVRTALVWDLLREALAERCAATGRASLDVLDTGGGTGGFAVPLAQLGHRVTVVDPSPDALAALERRAAEAGASDHIRAVQGDAAGLLDVVDAACSDVVLCHGVLEHVDDPAEGLAQVAMALRPGGLASVLVAQRLALVVARALAGHFDEAHRVFASPDGRWGEADPLPRRFDESGVVRLLRDAGLAPRQIHGIRVFSDLVPGALLDGEGGTTEALLALEAAVAEHPVFAGFAAQLHVLAGKQAHGGPAG